MTDESVSACGHSLGGVHGLDFPDIGGPAVEGTPGFNASK